MMHSIPNTKLAACYFLSGDEPLLMQEARDHICQQVKQHGFGNRQLLTIESPNDWQQLHQATQNLGLFNERQLSDLRHPSAKFDRHAQQALANYVTQPNPDTIVIISCAKLTTAQKKAKWFKAIEPHMRCQFIWPLQPREIPSWIQTRLKQQHLTADRESIKLLIELTEGNLLATNQAIQKLALLYPGQHITTTQMTLVIHDSAQFNVFDLINYILAGHTKQTLRTIDTLQSTGGEAILVLWALTHQIRELHTLIQQYNRGVDMTQLLAKQWSSKKPLLQLAITRLSLPTLNTLIKRSQQTDLMIKGAAPGDPWHNLKSIAITLTGALS